MSGKRKLKRRRKDASKLPVWFADSQRIWRDALNDLRRQLADHVRTAKPDKLRFQNGRLWECLWRQIGAAGTSEHRLITSGFSCYCVVTNRDLQLGYDEPRRLHFEEMRAAGLSESWQVTADTNFPDFVYELFVRIASITCWMEAQESFSMWLDFKDNHDFWQGDPDERARAFQAGILATPINYLDVYEFKGRQVKGMKLWEGLGVGTNYKGVPWSPRQWAKILEQAAKLAKRGHNNCTPLEQWVWWCYPVFYRYGWSAREVQDAASFKRFTDDDSWKVIEKLGPNFGRYWITRGLRFHGKKTKRTNPPLAEFVRSVSLPDPDTVRGVPIWFLSLTKKN